MAGAIEVFADPAALADAAARRIVDAAQAAVKARGRFTIALSGGSTPRAIHERLAAAPLRDELPWADTYVFWGDDRAVPHDDPDSNYRMAAETLLRLVPLPKANIHPMLTEGADLDAAAQHYARVIRGVVAGDPPRFDLILLGIGPDGHTASLFPHSPALAAADELVVATPPAPLKPQVRRITFTKTLLNAAALVLVLVTGADKAARLAEIVAGPRATERLPAQLIAPTNGELVWMVDEAAAGKLG